MTFIIASYRILVRDHPCYQALDKNREDPSARLWRAAVVMNGCCTKSSGVALEPQRPINACSTTSSFYHWSDSSLLLLSCVATIFSLLLKVHLLVLAEVRSPYCISYEKTVLVKVVLIPSVFRSICFYSYY